MRYEGTVVSIWPNIRTVSLFCQIHQSFTNLKTLQKSTLTNLFGREKII